MKRLFSFLVVLMICSCAQAQEDSVAAVPKKPKYTRDTLFTHGSAERILGQSGVLTESKFTAQGNSRIYQSAYTAYRKDVNTGKTGTVYYFMEQFDNALAAHRSYMDIKLANQKNGIKPLRGIGDEAYFHSDNENFYYIMVRKGNKGFRIKVNKITAHTNLSAFNEVARNIAEEL